MALDRYEYFHLRPFIMDLEKALQHSGIIETLHLMQVSERNCDSQLFVYIAFMDGEEAFIEITGASEEMILLEIAKLLTDGKPYGLVEDTETNMKLWKKINSWQKRQETEEKMRNPNE